MSALHSNSSHASLIQRAVSTEPEAWGTLVRLYSPMVYQWARNQGMLPADAAAITQKVFQAARAGLKTISHQLPEVSFRAWLGGLVLKTSGFKASSSQNKMSLHPNGEVHQDQSFDPQSAGTDQFASRLFDQLPQRALNLVQSTVDQTTWQAFSRVVILGELEAKVAESLKLLPADVRMAKYLVLYRLRLLLLDH